MFQINAWVETEITRRLCCFNLLPRSLPNGQFHVKAQKQRKLINNFGIGKPQSWMRHNKLATTKLCYLNMRIPSSLTHIVFFNLLALLKRKLFTSIWKELFVDYNFKSLPKVGRFFLFKSASPLVRSYFQHSELLNTCIYLDDIAIKPNGTSN